MKNRGVINIAVDALLLLCLTLVGGIGFMLKYVLPTGRERMMLYGGKVDLFLLGLDRREWGTVHLVSAWALLAILCLHLILHWPHIKALLKRAMPAAPVRRAVTAAVCLAATLLLLSPFVLRPTPGERSHEPRSAGGPEESLQHGGQMGRMTLAEASRQFGAPTSVLKQRLGLPDEVPDEETLGHLRRELGIEMSEMISRMNPGAEPR